MCVAVDMDIKLMALTVSTSMSVLAKLSVQESQLVRIQLETTLVSVGPGSKEVPVQISMNVLMLRIIVMKMPNVSTMKGATAVTVKKDFMAMVETVRKVNVTACYAQKLWNVFLQQATLVNVD